MLKWPILPEERHMLEKEKCHKCIALLVKRGRISQIIAKESEALSPPPSSMERATQDGLVPNKSEIGECSEGRGQDLRGDTPALMATLGAD